MFFYSTGVHVEGRGIRSEFPTLENAVLFCGCANFNEAVNITRKSSDWAYAIRATILSLSKSSGKSRNLVIRTWEGEKWGKWITLNALIYFHPIGFALIIEIPLRSIYKLKQSW